MGLLGALGEPPAAKRALLFGAGVLMRGFVELQRVDTGFESSGVTTFEVNLPETRYADGESRRSFHRTFHDRLRAAPGVRAVDEQTVDDALDYHAIARPHD